MKLFKIFTATAILLATLSSCKKDLNLTPTNDITADVTYANAVGYKSVLTKVYASFATTGGNGAGSSDLGGIDAGTSDFIRLYWNAQELTSDEGICVWNDPGVYDLNFQTYTSDNVILRGLYTRSLYQITVINEFLRESTPEKLASRNITGTDATNITAYRAEARFLRAYQYWVLMDLYGNPPFITEANDIGKVAPQQIKRADLFKYVESELLAIESELPGTSDYGRVTKGADQMLLSRVYLNASVYTGTAKNTEAAAYASKVIGTGYSLNPVYKNLFLADNNLNLKIIVEARDLNEVREIIANPGVHRILLDNFDYATTREAVTLIGDYCQTESSGGINEETMRHYAECGVNYISSGALTHSVYNMDLSLKAF